MAKLPNRLQWDFEWRTTAVTFLLLPVFIFLSYWQLTRAADKTALSQTWEQRQAQSPVDMGSLLERRGDEVSYLPVTLQGEFLPEQYFLLDNRISQGRFGYEVIAVMVLEGTNTAVLVNRGWIAGDSSRHSLPAVPVLPGWAVVSGHVYVPPGEPFLLADIDLPEGWPKRIQALEIHKLAAALPQQMALTLYPFQVRIDADQTPALQVNWQIINMSPMKHEGYALQWFAMALALLIIFLLRSSNIWSVLMRDKRDSG